LPNTSLNDAVQIARRMLATVQALKVEHLTSELGHLSISLGVAAVTPTDALLPQTLIAEADKQLYQAKQDGRARVSFCALSTN
jgi:diguanylate cyclase (GGDEF)-like protein